ncbi:MAG: acylphosphatase [Candidatus Woesearchaeota archaeon]
MKRVHLLIKGRVQMVGFRYFTKRKAQSLNLNGWVKNLSNGDVEAVVEGEKSAIAGLIEFCHKGPLFAKVTNVKATEEPYQKEFKEFEIRY